MPLPLYIAPASEPAPPALAAGPALRQATVEILYRTDNLRKYLLVEDFDTLSASWALVSGASAPALGTLSEDPFNGLSSLKQVSTTSVSSAIYRDNDYIPVVPSTLHSVQALAKQKDGAGASRFAEIVVREYDSSQTIIGSSTTGFTTDMAIADQWYFVNLEKVSASNAAYWRIDLQARKSTNFIITETFWWDQVRMWRGSHRSYERVAMVSDLISGVVTKRSLIGFDELSFDIPFDRFVPSQQLSLQALQASWNVEDVVPFNKQGAVRAQTYIRYTGVDGRARLYRINTLNSESTRSLSGTAVEAGVELSDYLTQYRPGRTTYSGRVASSILTRLLTGRKSAKVVNRKFSQDSPVTMTLASDVRDQTPRRSTGATADGDVAGDAGRWFNPKPYFVELFAVNPNDPAMFSGLPAETVPPNGTTRALTTGSFGYHGFNCYPAYIGAGIAEGAYVLVTNDGPVTGQINVSISGQYRSPEDGTDVCRIIYGAVKAIESGVYTFRFASNDGHRVYFRGSEITDDMNVKTSPFSSTWTSELEANKWYPFIFHQFNKADATQLFQFYWTRPALSEALVPSANLSPDLHGGLGLCRFVDVMGVVRYMTYYKSYTGRSLILAFPIAVEWPPSITNGSLWPKALPAGATIEEVRFPASKDLAAVVGWGTGWCRRPGARSVMGPPVESAKMQLAARGY